MSQNLFLGIDIGTSKVAAVISDANGQVAARAARPHHADLPAPAGHAEQDPATLETVAMAVVDELPRELCQRIRAVGVTGQVHGVLLLDARGGPVSPLITWQDQRAARDPGFLTELQRRTGHALKPGFGGATLPWLLARGAAPSSTASVTTILGWFVMGLSGSARPQLDPTDAATWGLFDLRALDWDRAATAAARIPATWLPPVVPCGTAAGEMGTATARRWGIPAGVPVAVGIGDNQASLVATLHDPEHELALTLGTGGQLSAVLPRGAPLAESGPTFEYRPFPGGQYAAVAASLCGGAAWAWLARAVAEWTRALGLSPPALSTVYERLNAVGLAATEEIEVHPHFLGERYDAALRGSLEGLRLDNFTLGAVARGLARGIARTLQEMLPAALYRDRRRLVGSGNALRLNPLLRQMAEEVFRLPLVLREGREEAATGAAMIAARTVPPT